MNMNVNRNGRRELTMLHFCVGSGVDELVVVVVVVEVVSGTPPGPATICRIFEVAEL